MRQFAKCLRITLSFPVLIFAAGHALAAEPVLAQAFTGMCDASAAVPIDETHFVLFDDEKKSPFIYDTAAPAKPVDTELKDSLAPVKGEEFDFEGAALADNMIFGISSHARKKGDDPERGEPAPVRKRFFAFPFKTNEKGDHKLAGFRTSLMEDLIPLITDKTYDLSEATEFAPETEHGLNIEGLASWGKTGVLVGLRGPVLNGQALVIPIVNPKDYVSKPDAKLSIEQPIPLSMNGLGIRDIAWIKDHYVIIAGPWQPEGDFVLYKWSGKADDHNPQPMMPLKIKGQDNVKPEAVFSLDDGKTISILSDDGDYIKGLNKDTKCKDLPFEKQKFRMFDLPGWSRPQPPS